MYHILFTHSSADEHLGCFFSSYSCHCLSFLQLQITFNVTFDVNPDTYFGNKLLLKANVTR